MRFLRILPAVCPRISWPFSSSTRNMALGNSSTTLPRISSNSSLAKSPSFLSLVKVAEPYSARARPGKARDLDGEDGRSAGFAGFERAVGFGRILEGEALLDLDLDLALGNHREQLGRALLEL